MFYTVYYLFWRATETLNQSALIVSIIFWLLEFQGTINFYLLVLSTWNVKREKPLPPKSNLKVDVFVPTYNESIKILEATLIGCLNMRYPHKTYILDDGRREEVRQLAERLGCEYLTRENNEHAKAGNINKALGRTDGDFIAIFDADMVPQPDFLEKTLGYFRDRKTAVVQLPQEFYNMDSMQHNSSNLVWHEQQTLYRALQPGRNSIDAAFWCGSPSIVRRKALEDIGGVATESVTEDLLTTIKLNAKGWKVKFHDEPLAFGIAPQSLHAFNIQRSRWAKGSMEILKSKFNPLLIKGLSLKQRLAHFSVILIYFDAYQKLMYMVLPLIYMLTGLAPLKNGIGSSFLIHWLIYLSLISFSVKLMGRGYVKFIDVEKFNILKMFIFIRATISIFFSKKHFFQVTPKVVDNSIKKTEVREIRNHIALFMLILVCILAALIKTYIKHSGFMYVASPIFWSAINLALVGSVIYDVLKRVYRRVDYRFPIRISVLTKNETDKLNRVIMTDISKSGVGFVTKRINEFRSDSKITMIIDDNNIVLEGTVVYTKLINNEIMRVGINFDEMTPEQSMKLSYYLFIKVPRAIYNNIELEKYFKGNSLPYIA